MSWGSVLFPSTRSTKMIKTQFLSMRILRRKDIKRTALCCSECHSWVWRRYNVKQIMSWLNLLVVGLTGSGKTSWKAIDLKLEQGTDICSADRKHLPSHTDLNLHSTCRRCVSGWCGWLKIESTGLREGGMTRTGEERCPEWAPKILAWVYPCPTGIIVAFKI